jgi:hypothetical protein
MYVYIQENTSRVMSHITGLFFAFGRLCKHHFAGQEWKVERLRGTMGPKLGESGAAPLSFNGIINGGLMGFKGGLMGCCGGLMGFNGGLRGFTFW